ncbi:MAG: hypothetical protein RLZZ175_472 [Bacteroidota bacterium]|jgi:dTDP-4-dehydrorhamnose 3,5-epimerase
MEFVKSHIEGLIEIFPSIFPDERGIFFESYSEKKFKENGLDLKFVQDNQSFSHKGVLRGLHFQANPHGQGKLVKVSYGKALDVVVDLRMDSKTFGQHKSFILDSERHNMVYIPVGFAHGFLALEDVVLQYKCTGLYNKQSEGGIIWNDKDLNINWGIENPIVSSKDLELPTFEQLKLSGNLF